MKLLISSMVDGYKLSHAAMYADGTEVIYSNLTPRSDKHYKAKASSFYDGKLVFVGAQAAVGEIVEMFDNFFGAQKREVMDHIHYRLRSYTGEVEHDMVKRWESLHDLGYLPLEFRALPEGTKVEMGVPVLTVTNTHKDFYWLVNYIESLVSSILWKTCTNATIANEYKRMAQHYAEKTGVDDFTVSIQFHDFSVRGMSGPEDAARSGMGHLSSFVGSDNLPSFDYVDKWYGRTEGLAMGVPATEHAVATNNILYLAEKGGLDKQEAEKEFLVDLLTRKFPDGIVSYVSDSFDYWALVSETLPAIKDVVLSRKSRGLSPGRLVIRPDSGDPVEVICGKGNNGTSSQDKGTIQCLWETFGGTINEKGYKVLDSHIGLIYGDSITLQRAEEIFKRLEAAGFSSGNVVLGIGSYTYQSSTRDTFGFAVKATATNINGEDLTIYKDPKTDSKKKSAKGYLFVDKETKKLEDCVSREKSESNENLLEVYFVDGVLNHKYTFNELRYNIQQQS